MQDIKVRLAVTIIKLLLLERLGFSRSHTGSYALVIRTENNTSVQADTLDCLITTRLCCN